MAYSGLDHTREPTLNHNSIVPLYAQLAERLQKRIEGGIYPVGARLPSERELSEQHNVSRMTARQALQVLIQRGFAEPKVGKGTFVSLPKINQELARLTSFTDEMRRLGIQTSSRVLNSQLEAANAKVAEQLQISVGAEVVSLVRTRIADGKPLALEKSYLNHDLCPGILDAHDFERESLYEVLSTQYGILLSWATQVIEARLPTPAECRALEINSHDPVLSLTRVTFQKNERPVEYARSVYIGSRYKFEAILRGTATT